MSDVTCAQARDAAAEFALGILPPDERSTVAAHILRCPECRQEVEELERIGTDLLDVIPDAEPSLGFDRRVLAAVQPRRRHPRRILAVLGAAAAAAAAVIGLVVSQGGKTHTDHSVTAALASDGHVIGSVYTEGNPAWVSMTVRQAGVSGRVTCDLIRANGASVALGSFDLVKGSGSWAAPEPADIGQIVGARLVGADGHIVATATFKV
jgi:anti-sigma factor RsiW